MNLTGVPPEQYHALSRWEYMTYDSWTAFVRHHLRHTGIPESDAPFSVLEVGSGVGAFARVVMMGRPSLKYDGIDIAFAAVQVSRVIAPAGRFFLGDVRDIEFLPTDHYDLVVAPGVLGYLRSLRNLQRAVGQMAKRTKSGGFIVASLLSYESDGLNSQNLIVPKSWWNENAEKLGCVVIATENMDQWSGCQCDQWQTSRYAVYLKKV